MYVLILIALVVGTVALTRQGLLPTHMPDMKGNPAAFWMGLAVLLQAGVLAMIGAVLDAAERRGTRAPRIMTPIRNLAMGIAGILIFAILLAGCSQPAPTPAPVVNEDVMSGPETARAPFGWRAYCERPENQPDPAC